MNSKSLTIFLYGATTLAGLIFTALASPSSKRIKNKKVSSENKKSPANSAFVPSPSAEFADPGAGWRRARQIEVSEPMVKDAIQSLSLPIGTFLNRGSYGVAIETHFNREKGEHKGASIFVPV